MDKGLSNATPVTSNPGRFQSLSHMLGRLLLLYSATLLVPLLFSVFLQDGEIMVFAISFLLTLGMGLLISLLGRGGGGELRIKDGFIIVASFWLILGFVGATPFILGPHLALADALFESVSGLTTTGATVIEHLDTLPPSLLFYRQQLQWLGGAGIIVLAVAVLPMLGVGGMQMFKAETPGPMKDEKITPRIMGTARALWGIYLSLTLGCTLAYWVAGMNWFDAAAHALATVSTGGFSTHDASLGYFNNPGIEFVAIVFMLLGGINFSVHFLAWRQRRLIGYLKNPEVRVFLGIILLLGIFLGLVLWRSGFYAQAGQAFRLSIFHVISIITSTGFSAGDFTQWPLSIPFFLILIGFIGGCAGSTAGGLKVIRIMILGKQAVHELAYLVHPHAVIPVKIGAKALGQRTLDAVWGFFTVYIASFVILLLLMLAVGVDQVTAFSAIATSINNLGPGLGAVSANFHDLGAAAKSLCVAAMLLGRLEVFTFLVILSPAFWLE